MARSPRRSKTRKDAEAKGYRSGFEQRVAEGIERDGGSVCYEPDSFSYEINEFRKYTPDFKLSDRVYVECKGRLTAADRKKLRLVKEQLPDIEIRLVFQYDNKLSPRSKTRYSTWAEKYGFKWALKEVPAEWL